MNLNNVTSEGAARKRTIVNSQNLVAALIGALVMIVVGVGVESAISDRKDLMTRLLEYSAYAALLGGLGVVIGLSVKRFPKTTTVAIIGGCAAVVAVAVRMAFL